MRIVNYLHVNQESRTSAVHRPDAIHHIWDREDTMNVYEAAFLQQRTFSNIEFQYDLAFHPTWLCRLLLNTHLRDLHPLVDRFRKAGGWGMSRFVERAGEFSGALEDLFDIVGGVALDTSVSRGFNRSH